MSGTGAGKIRKLSQSGYALIRDPLLNKGAAFTAAERGSFGLEGILPHKTLTIEMQRERVIDNLSRIGDPLEKYVALASLQDRNEHLFFNVLTHHLEELMPIVYTPTVGLATQRYSHVFQRGRGVWITPGLRGRVAKILRNAAAGRQVRLIVATDNESILGIGDQGAGGMAISIGKLALYTAAAGIDPALVLPVSIDVGTDNEELLADPLYLGWPERRLRGPAYLELIDEFVEAVRSLFPGALVQWEDFRKDNALRVLDRYRSVLPSFNDDIQGTGAVALAGIIASEQITGRDLRDERVVILGGGAAGLGIARQIRAGMTGAGAPMPQAGRAIAVLDSRGLIVDGGQVDGYKRDLAMQSQQAHDLGLVEGRRDLRAVVAKFRPTVLIGASGQAGAFTEDVVKAMAREAERPVILPLSNPTSACEAQPADVLLWTHGRALVATGSPFPDVVADGVKHRIGQGNNAYVFPAVGLAAMAGHIPEVTDEVFLAAARSLAATVTRRELDTGLLYPPIARLRQVTRAVASAVLSCASGRTGATDEEIDAVTWEPAYAAYEPA